jgi:hypothetical protein
MTQELLESRLKIVESMINRCTDPKDLPYLNRTYQLLLDKLVAIDLQQANPDTIKPTDSPK